MCDLGRHIHFADSGSRLGRLKPAVPNALSNTERSAAEVVYFQGQRFTDSETGGRQQCIQHCELSIRFADDCLDFFWGERGSSLTGHLWQVDELMVPLSWVK